MAEPNKRKRRLGPSDTELARRWQHGDRNAAATAMARYTDLLGAIAYGIVHDVSLAEDVVQETYARAARDIGRLRETSKLGGYLVGIARNVAKDIAKKQRREAPLDFHDPPAKNDTLLQAKRSELRTHLRKAVAELPEDQRELFNLKYVAGATYRQIAKALGITETAVSQKLWRIRKKLQETLQEIHHDAH